ncbi:tripartite tricarboxylate transporter TctB family protein [Desulfitobacterium sp. AusDCA]|uniref:tripartite tricarboxylate transporter TctB family protein n=1 Tax=Desulfitobacterium sp. AusDCA TaxID=3240383 RepID=UPI003DA773FB
MGDEGSELKDDNIDVKIPVTKKTDFKTGVIFLAISVFVIIEASKMPKQMPGVDFGPGILPFWLGVVLAIFSLLLIGQSFQVKNSMHSIIKRDEIIGVGSLFIVLGLYIALMDVLGFGIDTFILVALLARRLGHYALWKCLLLGAITGTLTVYLFRVLLNLPLPIGLLGF